MTRPGACDFSARLSAIVRSAPMLMDALRVARTFDPPDWLIGAGAIRDLVWDRLHDYEVPTPPKDVDLVYFNPTATSREDERALLAALRRQAPEIPWDVTNQATVHHWYPEVFGVSVEPLSCSADAVGTWPETATCVAIRLAADNRIEIIAPYGLDDLFGLVYRRNPRRVTVEEYRRRVERKHIADRWPAVEVVPGDQ